MAATHSPVTATNHSALVVISVYFLMITFVLSVAIRFAIRLGIAKAVSKDDWFCLASTVVGIGQVIAVQVGVNNGLGKSEDRLTQKNVKDVLKAQYASSYFYVVALGLSKVSILLLLRRLVVQPLHKRIALYTTYVVAAWTAAALITLAARCGAHLPWNVSAAAAPAQCINIKTFWIAMTPLDVLTELLIVTIPVLMMIPVQVAVSKKFVIIFAFLFRLFVVGASVTRLFFLLPHVPAKNFTFKTVNAEILTQVVLCMSITTACIPCLKPFLDAFDSGQMAVNIRVTGGSGSNSRSYAMNDLAYGNGLAYGAKSGVQSRVVAGGDEDDEDSITAAKYGLSRSKGTSKGDNAKETHGSREKNDDGSVTSDASDQYIIKKNVQWTVSYEDVDSGRREVQLAPSNAKDATGMSPSRIRGSQTRPSDDSEEDADPHVDLGHRQGGESVGYTV